MASRTEAEISHHKTEHKNHFTTMSQDSWWHQAATWVPDTTHHPPGAAHRSSSARAFCRNWNFLLSWRSLKEERERKPAEGELRVMDLRGQGFVGLQLPLSRSERTGPSPVSLAKW